MLRLDRDICKEIASQIVNSWIEEYGMERIIMSIAANEMSFTRAAIDLSNQVGESIENIDCGFLALYETLEPFIVEDLEETWYEHGKTCYDKSFIQNNRLRYGSID